MLGRLWVSEDAARAQGCTHRGLMFGLVPGFFDPDRGIWVSRSLLFLPLEDWLRVVWAWRGRAAVGEFVVCGVPLDVAA
jgi:hypothetical protein